MEEGKKRQAYFKKINNLPIDDSGRRQKENEKITDYEWARMAKKYAQDLFDNGEIDQDELDEHLDYYEDEYLLNYDDM